MSIIFFGNTKYSQIDEEELHKELGLRAVVTIPDQLLGRKKILTPTPTKDYAVANHIPVITTKKLDDTVIAEIETHKPDFLVIADYGLILPQRLLDVPKIAALNIHHSLLPKYRGPSPAPAAILNGEKTTGVTIIKMAQDVDAGDIMKQETYEIQPDDTTDSLLRTLNTRGSQLAVDVLKNYSAITPTPQDNAQATFTPRMTKQDGYIDLENPPDTQTLDRMIRAYYPWPAVWTKFRIKNLELRIKFLPKNMLQMEGKKPMSVREFLNGYPELTPQLVRLGFGVLS